MLSILSFTFHLIDSQTPTVRSLRLSHKLPDNFLDAYHTSAQALKTELDITSENGFQCTIAAILNNNLNYSISVPGLGATKRPKS